MGNFSFHIVNSEEVKANVMAIRLLTEAAHNFGGIHSLDTCFKQSDEGVGFFVFVKKETKLRGVFFIIISQQEIGDVMTLVYMGGYELDEWKDELADFLYKCAKELDIDQFFYMGRQGFSRLFPQLEEVLRVYRVILKAPGENIK